MTIFKNNNLKLEQVKELKIDLEKDIQKLTEDNLADIFGLAFVRSEFQMDGLRIDTLAWNEETSSFVIIEYKRDRSFSVIDQGYAYLSLRACLESFKYQRDKGQHDHLEAGC
jgi:RecB family endonuclease NucS